MVNKEIDIEIKRITNHLKELDKQNYTAENNPVYKFYQDSLKQLKELKENHNKS